MIRILFTVWWYIRYWKPKKIYVRLPILLCVGGFVPILINLFVAHRWDLGAVHSAELTFLLCIPVAAWMMDKIAQRWHDDEDDE